MRCSFIAIEEKKKRYRLLCPKKTCTGFVDDINFTNRKHTHHKLQEFLHLERTDFWLEKKCYAIVYANTSISFADS